MLQIINAGASACVLKRSAGTELVTAIKAVARGESYFSPAMAAMLLEDYRGMPRRETAEKEDLQAHDRTDLVKSAIRKGIIISE